MVSRRKSLYGKVLILSVVAQTAIPGLARAANKYLDNNGTTTGSGVTNAGTYLWSSALWNTNSSGTGATTSFASGDTAIFSAGTDASGSYTASLGAAGAQTVGGLTLEEGNVSITGGTLTLNSGSTVNVGTGLTLTVTSTFAGSDPATITGGGTFRLTNIQNSATGAVSVTGGSTLSLAASGDIGGTGVGSGDITLNNGTLANSDTTLGISFLTANRNILIGAGGGNISFTTSTLQLYGGTISGTGNTLTKSGSGEIRMNGSTDFTFTKLAIIGGLYALGQSGAGGRDGQLGAVPTSFLSDQITLTNGGGIRFNTAGLSINANRGITLGTGGGLLVANGTATVNGAITGTGALTVGSSGNTANITLTSTSNNWSGGTTIQNSASLQFAKKAAMPSTGVVNVAAGALIVNAGGTNEWTSGTSGNGSIGGIVGGVGGQGSTVAWVAGDQFGIDTSNGNLTYAGNIGSFNTSTVTPGASTTNSVGVSKVGTGTLTLTGNSTYIGVTNITGGTLSVNNLASGNSNSAIGASTNSATNLLISGGIFKYTGANVNTDRLFSIGTGTSAATVDASGSGAVNFNNIGSMGLIGFGTRTLTLTGTNTGNNTLAAVIANDSSGNATTLAKSGVGNWILSGTNTYTGKTTITAGTLSVSADANLGGAPAAFTADQLGINGGTLAVTTGFTVNANRGIAIGSSGGTINIASGQTLNVGSAGAGSKVTDTSSGVLTITGGGTFAADNDNSTTFTTGKWYITGGSKWAALSNQNRSGATPSAPVADFFTLDNGIYSNTTLASNTPATNKGITLGAGGGTFEIGNGDVTTIPGAITGGGSLTKTSAGTLALTGSNNYSGSTTISGGAITINGSSNLGDGTGTLNLSGGNLTTTADRSSAPVANPLNLTADSAITTTSTAATPVLNFTSNSIAGTGGTLTLRNDAASGTGLFEVRFSGSGFNFSRPVAITNGTFGSTRMDLFNASGTSQTFSGAISGTGSINRSSSSGTAGETVFTQANTYSGGTTINNSTLTVTNTTGSGTGSGNISITGSGVLNVGNGGQGGSVSGNISMASSSGQVNFGNAKDSTYGGAISGAGSVTVNGGSHVKASGNAALTLTGTSSYTGVTTLTGGTVSVSSIGNGGSNGNIGAATNAASNLVIDGGKLSYTGAGETTDRLFSVGTANATIDSSGTGAIVFNNNGSIGFASETGARTLTLSGTNTGANTIAAIIGDNGGATSLSKLGAGTWVLTGSNTYSGGTEVRKGGELVVNNASGSGTGSGDVHVFAAASLGGNGTIGGNVNNAGTINPGNSPGVLTIAGALNNTGELDFELAGTAPNQYDQLSVGGAFTAGGTIKPILEFTPITHEVFYIMNFGSFINNGYSFDFSQASLPAGFKWDTSKFATDGEIAVVPLPSALSAGLVLLVGGAVYTRRMRKQPADLKV